MSLRTFLAIDLPSCLLDSIVKKQQAMKPELPFITWGKSENLHLTLKFLGDTPESKIPELQQVVAKAVKGIEPFVINLRGFGVFPDKWAPRTLWTGIEGDLEVLLDLTRKIETEVNQLGFPPEGKPFRPHLTLARIKKNQRATGKAIEKASMLADPFIFGSLLVEQVTLFKSELRPTGSVYTKLWAVSLAIS